MNAYFYYQNLRFEGKSISKSKVLSSFENEITDAGSSSYSGPGQRWQDNHPQVPIFRGHHVCHTNTGVVVSILVGRRPFIITGDPQICI